MPNLYRWKRLLRQCAFTLAGAIFLFHGASAADRSSTGSIAGRVISLDTGEDIAGAMVTVQGTALSATTDLTGSYRIDAVPVGTHALLVVHPRYQNSTITGIRVAAGGLVKADLPMDLPAGQIAGELVELDEFIISADVLAGSGLALLGARQKAATVSDAIGSDFFGRVDAGDAAEAMSKVTGATVLDGKYVLIRGLGDRYSNTLLNGASVPSADPDRRAVQMDQFPSSVLESIVTSKSFTPDQPGGFAGGSVDMRTKSFPERFFVSVGLSAEHNTATTGKDVLSIPGGGRDWLGKDDGTRALPEGLPDRIPSQTEGRIAARSGNFGPAEELERISNLFNNDTYFPHTASGRPKFGFDFSTGDRIPMGGDRLFGYVVSLTYDRGAAHYSGGYASRYSQGSFNPSSPAFVNGLLVYSADLDDLSYKELYEAAPGVPDGEPQFGVARSVESVNWGAYAQLAFRPTLNHEFSLRYLQSQSADDQVKRGVGESTRSDAGRLYQFYELLYTERSVDSLQLSGRSQLPWLGDARVEWRASTSESTQAQPDYRTISYFWDINNQNYASAAGVGNNRYFRDLVEKGDELGLDVQVPFTFRGRSANLKLGGVWQDGERAYRERRFRWSREATQADVILNYPNPVGIVGRTANSVTFGNTISELPSNLVNYDGEQTISAGYAMVDIPATERLRLITGVRLENTQIGTQPLAGNINFRPADIDETATLPALSAVYDLGRNMNLRAAYGRTLARPLYHELADIRVEDAFRGKFRAGNPDLVLSSIDNFDLRWEWFPRGNEVFAVSLFDKSFQNPIEVIEVPAVGSEQAKNAPKGRVYGIEFEARFGLGLLWDRLASFSFGSNLALVKSEVRIPDDEMAGIRMSYPDAEDTRELLGQSPYVLNLDLSYDRPQSGTVATLACNIQGKRLYLVSFGALPDIYEMPAPSLDFILSQRLTRELRLKFAVKNLLDPQFDKTLTHNGADYYYESFKRGRTFSLGLTYSFE